MTDILDRIRNRMHDAHMETEHLLDECEEEIMRLRSELQALKQFGPATNVVLRSTSSTTETLVDCITTSLSRVGCPAPLYMVKSSAAGEKWNEKIVELEKFLEGLTKQQQRGVLQLGSELLIKHLLQFNVPLNARTMCRNVHRIPMVINDAFPGYRQAGLLQMLIRGEHDAR